MIGTTSSPTATEMELKLQSKLFIGKRVDDGEWVLIGRLNGLYVCLTEEVFDFTSQLGECESPNESENNNLCNGSECLLLCANHVRQISEGHEDSNGLKRLADFIDWCAVQAMRFAE